MNKSSPEYITDLLNRSNYAVERAILAIYNCQTNSEKILESTQEKNGKGFSGSDSRLGSYYAKYILSGNKLSGVHLEKARKMSHKYLRQLCEIAANNLKNV